LLFISAPARIGAQHIADEGFAATDPVMALLAIAAHDGRSIAIAILITVAVAIVAILAVPAITVVVAVAIPASATAIITAASYLE
jgi:hypothetical protein